MSRAAAICSIVLGLGFGLPGAYGALFLAREGRLWRFLGYPTYGEGPFVRWGLPSTVPLILAFVAVCAAEVVVGALLWADMPAAPWLALGLLPFEALFWLGFALPFGPPVGLARTVLVVLMLLGRG